MRKAPATAGAFLVIFILLAAAVHFRLLSELDYAAGRWARSMDIPPLDATATLMSVAFSAELSLFYGLAGATILWRLGARWWSLAPLAFVVITAVEIVLKELVQQPLPPAELTRPHLYPLLITSSALEGAFPSGYVLRVSFLSVFLAVVLWSRGGGIARSVAVLCIAMAVVLSFSRIYVGWHWLSDVVAGFLLGSAAALVLAPPVLASLVADPSAPAQEGRQHRHSNR